MSISGSWRRWLGCAALAGLLACAAKPVPPADLVVYGRIWTGDSIRPWAEAVATRGDTIIAVGKRAAVAPFVGSDTKVLANRGGMVVPGMMDGHTHFVDGGFELASIDLRPARTPEEFIARLKSYAAGKKPGEWILGGNWDHENWPGSPLPRRDWIDSVTPRNPVFVDRLDGHMALANTVALAKAGIDRRTSDIAGGIIVRDPKTGEPTGVLKDNAKDPVIAVIPPLTDEERDTALRRAMQYAAAKGVTGTAHVSADFADLPAYLRAKEAGKLTIRVALYFPLRAWRQVANTIASGGRGDDWVWIGGVKGFVDGSLGSRTALFDQPYLDDPATKGVLVTPEDSLRKWIGAADSAGLQVAVHAIGERANRLILDIYDSIATAHGDRDRRFRIEHAQHLHAQDIDRIAHSGVVASMQPAHILDDGHWAEKRIRPEQVQTTYAFRSLLDRHAHLAFGSDWSVAPMDPILGIYAAVTRRTRDGRYPDGWVPDQKITVEEALKAYTSGDAYGVFAESSRGKLVPGYRADLVLLDQDLMAIPPETIDRVRVRYTVVGGRVVYSSP